MYQVLCKTSDHNTYVSDDIRFWYAVADKFNIGTIENPEGKFHVTQTEVERAEYCYLNIPRHHPDLIEVFNKFEDFTNYSIIEIESHLYHITRNTRVIAATNKTIPDFSYGLEKLTTLDDLDMDAREIMF